MARASILVECGIEYGLGRVRRSLSLGSALRQAGIECTAYLTSEEGKPLANSLGFKAKPAPQIPHKPDILILDTASNSAAEVNALCATAEVSCVIDDLGNRPVDCNFIINPNLYAGMVDYSSYGSTRILRAPSFNLIHQDFFAFRRPTSRRKSIVVSFGGTDDGRLATPVATAIAEKFDGQIYIPVPSYFQGRAATKTPLAGNIQFLTSPDMAKLLGKSMLYVGAAGATVLEAMAAGCMVCASATQADQHQNISYLQSLNIPALDGYDPVKLASLALQTLSCPSLPGVRLTRNAPGQMAHIISHGLPAQPQQAVAL